MGVFFAILVIYGLYQLNRGNNGSMFNKVKAIWFEAQHGEGSVVKTTRNCVRPHSGVLLRVTFKSRFLRRSKEDTVLVRVPQAFYSANESVQDAVLVEILARDNLSVSQIIAIEEAEEAPLPSAEEARKLHD